MRVSPQDHPRGTAASTGAICTLMNDQDTNTTSTEAKDFTPKSCLLIATFGAALVMVGAFYALNSFRQELPPNLTRGSFDDAWDQWEETAPPDYHIEIDVVGPRTATYTVDVKDGAVTNATHNGDPLPSNPRTMRTWSVPGMFDTMERDVMHIETADASDLTLRAVFEPKYGYPMKYHRNDHRNKFEMRWTVKDFTVHTGGSEAEN